MGLDMDLVMDLATLGMEPGTATGWAMPTMAMMFFLMPAMALISFRTEAMDHSALVMVLWAHILALEIRILGLRADLVMVWDLVMVIINPMVPHLWDQDMDLARTETATMVPATMMVLETTTTVLATTTTVLATTITVLATTTTATVLDTTVTTIMTMALDTTVVMLGTIMIMALDTTVDMLATTTTMVLDTTVVMLVTIMTMALDTTTTDMATKDMVLAFLADPAMAWVPTMVVQT